MSRQLSLADADGQLTAMGAPIRALGLALLLAALLLPAFINRMPILYSDSVGYFHSGYAVIKEVKALVDAHHAGQPHASAVLPRQERDGVSTARSIYYGLPFVASYWLGGVWAPALAQALVTLAALLLAARHVRPRGVCASLPFCPAWRF